MHKPSLIITYFSSLPAFAWHRASKMNWKIGFEQTLAMCLSARIRRKVATGSEVFETTQSMTDTQRRGLWISVSEQLGITYKQAHDYFHNTYVKQFYENIVSYKHELVAILGHVLDIYKAEPLTTQQVIRETIKSFYKRYFNKRFHVYTIYSFLYHHIKTTLAQQAKNTSPKQKYCQESASRKKKGPMGEVTNEASELDGGTEYKAGTSNAPTQSHELILEQLIEFLGRIER